MQVSFIPKTQICFPTNETKKGFCKYISLKSQRQSTNLKNFWQKLYIRINIDFAVHYATDPTAAGTTILKKENFINAKLQETFASQNRYSSESANLIALYATNNIFMKKKGQTKLKLKCNIGFNKDIDRFRYSWIKITHSTT